ncbi:MAG: hypothetical protein V1898_00940 [Patescibacteria group bacterium]
MTKQKIIGIWCAPRSASTTLFMSFSQLKNIRAIFEPYDSNFYFSKERLSYRYLSKNKIDIRWNNYIEPKISNIINKKTKTGLTVFKECVFQASNYINFNLIKDVLYNIIIIRNPRLTLTSLYKFKKDFDEIEAGYASLNKMHNLLIKNKKSYIILDASDLISNPSIYMKKLCSFCKINYTDKLLSWPKKKSIGFGGQSDFYQRVLNSEGFLELSCRIPNTSKFSVEQQTILNNAIKIYNKLYKKRLIM